MCEWSVLIPLLLYPLFSSPQGLMWKTKTPLFMRSSFMNTCSHHWPFITNRLHLNKPPYQRQYSQYYLWQNIINYKGQWFIMLLLQFYLSVRECTLCAAMQCGAFSFLFHCVIVHSNIYTGYRGLYFKVLESKFCTFVKLNRWPDVQQEVKYVGFSMGEKLFLSVLQWMLCKPL